MLITALGQADRGAILCTIAYLFGYSGVLFALMQVKSRIFRLIIAFFWMFSVQLYQLSWLGTTTYHGFAIIWVYLWMVSWFAFQFMLIALFLPKTKNLTFSRGAAMAALWALFEVRRLHFLCGFPFNNTGLVLTATPYTMQMASLFGIFGLSFWVILTSACGARFFRDRTLFSGASWTVIAAVPLAFSVYHINRHMPKLKEAKYLNVASLQTGLAVEQKWRFPHDEGTYIETLEQWKNIFAYFADLKHETFDLIVLPEAALPGEAFYPEIEFKAVVDEVFKFNNRLPALTEPYAEADRKGRWYVSHAWIGQALSNLYKSELIMGLIDHDEELDESYNSAFHFVPFRETIHRYNKRVLVPLAEYLPLPMMGSFLEKYGITEFFTPGKKAKVFTGEVPLAVSICYEEGYSNLMREARLLGAQLFVNVTNDGWFPKSRLPQEHFNLGRVRSVENGVPVVRSCNTGVTGIVDSLGFVQGAMPETDSSGKLNSGIIFASLSSYQYPTLYSYFGNPLIVVISSLILLWFFSYRKALNL